MSLITDTPIGAADGRRCASDDEPPIPAGTSLPRVRTVWSRPPASAGRLRGAR